MDKEKIVRDFAVFVLMEIEESIQWYLIFFLSQKVKYDLFQIQNFWNMKIISKKRL